MIKKKESAKYILVLALAVLTSFALWPALDGQFTSLDDNQYLTENSNVQAGLNWQSVIWAFTTTEVCNYWHPLTWLSHMLDIEMFGMNPRGHHFVNLLLHVTNTILLFLLLQRMTGAMWRAALVAVLFAIHPLHVESVAWVSERKDVLSTLCGLVCLWAYCNYRDKPTVQHYLTVVAIFLLAIMAKPMMVTLPCLLLLLDYWPLGALGNGQDKNIWAFWSRRIAEKIPILVLAGIISVVTYYAQTPSVATLVAMPLSFRVANTIQSYGMYIYQMFVPVDLCCFYPLVEVRLGVLWSMWCICFLLVIPAIILRLHKRYTYLFVGWFWYVGILMPVIGLVQTGGQARADRYTYMSLIGLFIVIAWGIADATKKFPRRKVVLAALACCTIVCLISMTRQQCRVWYDNLSLYRQALRVTIDNEFVHNNLAVELMQRQRYDEAEYHLREAVRIKPYWHDAHYNLGNLAACRNYFEQAQLHYRRAIELQPTSAKAYNNLGVCLARNQELHQAIAAYRQAIKLQAGYTEAHYNIGLAYLRLARPHQAVEALQQAVARRHAYPEAHYALGNAYEMLLDFDQAAQCYRQALRYKPDYAVAARSLERVEAPSDKK